MKHEYIAITGASSGIGFEAALAFAQRGFGTVLVARRRERLEALSQQIRTRYKTPSFAICADLARPDTLPDVWKHIARYPLRCLINCAGFGSYGTVASLDPERTQQMISLNIGALTYFSQAFVAEYALQNGAQLINVSSAGGYTLVSGAAVYCATKFYVSAFTEALDRELQSQGLPLRAKVLAPAATETEFGTVASGLRDYDYDTAFPMRHSARQMARFLLELFDSHAPVGAVDRNTFEFNLRDYIFPSA